MKSLTSWIITALVIAGCASAGAQTYQTVRVDSIGTNYLNISTNTLCKLIGVQANGQSAVYSIFPGVLPSNNAPLFWFQASGYSDLPRYLIGPCQLMVVNNTSNSLLVAHFELAPVNVAPAPSLVQPSGKSAVLRVETSTNLETWQTITNATFIATNAHRFFRTTLTLP